MAALHTDMKGFSIWLLLNESGRLDQEGFNALFRAYLEDLLPRVTDARRQALIEMRDFDWMGYILVSLRNAGWHDRSEREEAAHTVVVYLLIQPGHLFTDAGNAGPMPARFALSVANAIRNLRRDRARRERRSPVLDADALAAVPDREITNAEDDDLLDALRGRLRQRLGDRAVELLNLRLDGLTFREIGSRATFAHLSRWGLRELVREIREEARRFARHAGDEDFLGQVERLLASRRSEADQDD